MAERVIRGNVVIGQSGGPTCVINESLVGIALEARRRPDITGVYGARNGIRGIIEERFVDLDRESVDDLERRPGSCAGCRRRSSSSSATDRNARAWSR